MSQSVVSTLSAAPASGEQPLSPLVASVRDLHEFRKAGMVSAEDYRLQRAEKLQELMCRRRGLWLGPLVAAGSCASVASSLVWLATDSWQATGIAAGLAALFGLAMLGRVCRDQIRQAQIAEKRAILQSMLQYDLLSAEEYLEYDDRLWAGE